MFLRTAAFFVHGYVNFKSDIRKEAENALSIFEAMHVQAMLNRGTTQDNDPVIATLDGKAKQLKKNQDRFTLWTVMGPKVIAYQLDMGHADVERPKDDVDREALNNARTVGRMTACRNLSP